MRDLLLPAALSALLHGAIVVVLPGALDGPRLEQVSSDAIEIVLAAGAPMAAAPVDEARLDVPPIDVTGSRASAPVVPPAPAAAHLPVLLPAATTPVVPDSLAPVDAPVDASIAADAPLPPSESELPESIAAVAAAVPPPALDLPGLEIAPSSPPTDLARGDRAATAPPGSNPPPSYPRIARRRGLEGEVLLCVLVLADGTCREVGVTRSSGHAVLDRAAVRAVEHWRFEPARRSGRSVDDWIEVPIEFHLTETGG